MNNKDLPFWVNELNKILAEIQEEKTKRVEDVQP